jgi:hypothetical protein
MTKAERRLYQRNYRKRHPHYSRDKMRERRRGTQLPRAMKNMFGIRVHPNVYSMAREAGGED